MTSGSRKEHVEDCAAKFRSLFWVILIFNILGSIIGAIVCFSFKVPIWGAVCLIDTFFGSLILAFIKNAWELLCSCILLKGTYEDKINVEEQENILD